MKAGDFKIEIVKISTVKPHPDNPRVIKDEQFKKLVQSIKDFPQMLHIRPIVVNDEMFALGGNQRLKAANEAGLKEIPVILASTLSAEQQREFMIKDNNNSGEWDLEALQKSWGDIDLDRWGLDLPALILDDEDATEKEKEVYTRKITPPIYHPNNEKPSVTTLVDGNRVKDLIKEIGKADISDAEKEFLIIAAYRHYVFDFSKIADFYAHSSGPVQDLMEKSALVIIDFNKAIENGYIQLSENLVNQYTDDEK